MGTVLTIEGQFPDADSEAAYVAAVVDLVHEFTADLSAAKLSTDFNGSPELPVGEALPPLAITGSLPPATVGAQFAASLNANGGTPPYAWAANGLPDGLNIDPTTGAVTGVPNVGGTATIQITVTDSAIPSPDQVTETFPLIVAGPTPEEEQQDSEISDLEKRMTAVESGITAILDKLNNPAPPAQ